MDSTQYAFMKRKREAVDPSDSDDECTTLTPQSSTCLIPKNSETPCSTKFNTNRSHRAGVNYDPKPQRRASTFPRKGKRHKNTPVIHKEGRTKAQARQLPPNEPPRSTSLILLPSESALSGPSTASGDLPEIPEIRELLNGKARSSELVFSNPTQSTTHATMSNITLGLELSDISNSPEVKQRKAGVLLTHWRRGSDVEGQRPDSNAYDSNNTQGPEPSTTTASAVRMIDRSATSPPQNLEHVASNDGPSDSPTPDDEESRTSYVKCDVNEHSEVSFEDIDMSTELSSDRSSTHDEEGGSAPTPPPPPQHGYPGTADAYRENVPVPNALKWNGSSIVWDNHDHPDSSQVLFDPGCKPNFISWKLALRLGFQPLLLPEAQWKLFSTLHGQQDLAQHYIKLDIEMRWLRFPRKSVYLLVVETDEIEILLGEYFLAEFGITERLVANAQARTASNAHAIITSKPTPGMIPSKPRLVLGIRLTHIVFPEQIRNVLLDKERRRMLAEKADANIREQEETQRLRRGLDAPSRRGISYSSSASTAGSAGEGVYGPKMATDLNSSFEPDMGRDQGNRMPSHRQASMASSVGRSSTDNSSFRDSLDSSPTGSTLPSPATTFSSKSTGSASSSFGRRMKEKVGNPFSNKGKEKEIG
jgi:hypothetical protein